MKIRFVADADLNRAILSGVVRREPAIEFTSAQTAGLHSLHDSEVLSLASARGFVLVSHDVGTMPTHFSKFRQNGYFSCGVILIPQRLSVGIAIEELILIWLLSEASEWENRIAWLPL